MTRYLLFPGLLALSVLAACSSNAVEETQATVAPTLVSTPTYIPTPTPTPAPPTTPTSSSPPTATLTPISLTFKPVADSEADQSNPRTNFGTSNGLRVDSSPVVNSYLRFNIQGLGTRSISRVRLLIYSYTATSQGIEVKTIADNAWGEKTITANNAPSLGGTLAASTKVAARAWITFDVTSYITGEGTFSFGLSTSGSRAVSLAARESVTYSPQLVVDLQ